MAAGIVSYNQFVTTGTVTWTINPTPDTWLIVFHGVSGGSFTDMTANPAAARSDWETTPWQLLGQVEAAVGGPRWRVWGVYFTDSLTRKFDLNTPDSLDSHSHLYFVNGMRPGTDAEHVFSVGAGGSPVAQTGQPMPLYAPDSSGLLIGGWLTAGAAVNYTSLGPLTARAELDGAVSTSRTGEQTVSAYGPSTRSATSSAAQPWAAMSVIARDATGSVTFPNQPLGIRTEIAPSASPDADPATWAGLWTDVTADVYARQPIAITRGRADEASTVGPSTMSLELNNSGGKYTRRNPLSPLYGQLSKNTPVRTWVNPGSGWELRYTGFVSEWPPRQQGGDVDQHMPIEAAGVTRRLGQGRPLRSPMVRTISRGGYVAYWPLETDAASGIVGGSTMRTVSEVNYSADGGPPGSAGAASFGQGGQLYGIVTGMSNTGGWSISWWLDVPLNFDGSTDASVLVDWQIPGMQYSRWSAYVSPGSGGKMVVAAFEPGGASATIVGTIDLRGTGSRLIAVMGVNDGPDTRFALSVDGVFDVDGFVAGQNTAPITNVDINGYFAATDQTKGSISHLVATAIAPTFGDNPVAQVLAPYGSGYNGEQATTRIMRLVAEESIPAVIVGDDGASEQMGVQRADTLLNLLRECEAADGGVLYERRDGRLAYAARAGRYNQTPALTLDYAARQVAPPLEPTDDDRLLRNDVEVSRSGGSSARVTDPDSIDAVGLYGESVSINVASDNVLADHAGWRVHLGTNDDLRYPAVTPNINGQAAAVIPGWLGLDVGNAAAITNPATDLAAGTVRLLAEGYTENIDTVSWVATLNCSPGAPWRTIVLNDTTLGRIDTDGSELSAAVTSTTASISVTAKTGPAWTTSAGDLPVDIMVGGEQMTVSAITALTTLNSDPGFNTVGAWSASGGTFTATGVGQLTPNGTSGTVQVFSTPHATVTAGAVYQATGLLQNNVSRSVNFVVNWYNSSDVFLSATTVAVSLTANVLTSVDIYVTAPAGAAKAAIGATMTGTPPASNVLFLDGFFLNTTQTMTVARSVNGVVKSHSVGEDVRLATPPILAL